VESGTLGGQTPPDGRGRTDVSDPTDRAAEPRTAATGYAPVNGLEMYYEVHGSGGTPLLLLHGGLFNIDLQFGELLPGLAASRQVIAADFQGHGRTNDIDRPLTCADLAGNRRADPHHRRRL
jgi:pimeloyl-ACP methyl ester carboxylesterase